jgi:hypothetical protein
MPAYCGLPVQCKLSTATRTLDLMDAGQGFRISSLDLSFPSVREDVTDAPEQSGTIDTTAYFSSRAVTITGSIVASASGSRTKSLELLSPFLDPAARPVLTYQTDADADPRQMTLRAYQLSAPMDNPAATTWQAQWKAPGSVAQGITTHTASVGAAAVLEPGRIYPLTYNRTYPSSSRSVSVVVVPSGDYPTPPVFTVYGPISGAVISVIDTDSGQVGTITLQAGYTIAAGNSLTIDCGQRTIVDNTGANAYGAALDHFAVWPVLTPGDHNAITLNGTGAAGSTLLAISWLDRWLI